MVRQLNEPGQGERVKVFCNRARKMVVPTSYYSNVSYKVCRILYLSNASFLIDLEKYPGCGKDINYPVFAHAIGNVRKEQGIRLIKKWKPIIFDAKESPYFRVKTESGERKVLHAFYVKFEGCKGWVYLPTFLEE